MTPHTPALDAGVLDDATTLWDYHQMGHQLHPVDVAIGLGSHDLGVATHVADLYHRGLFPRLVFTGANAPTTIERFPRGEAVHYREHALNLGVPDDAILVEPRATNTGENITFTRDLLAANGLTPSSAILVSRPYQQRRAYATAKKLWPDLHILCSSQDVPFEDYLHHIGDTDRVINMLVGDTQRITTYAQAGFAIRQAVPAAVDGAFRRLVEAGYKSRLA